MGYTTTNLNFTTDKYKMKLGELEELIIACNRIDDNWQVGNLKQYRQTTTRNVPN